MWQTTLICSGKIKSGPYSAIQDEYCKRITPTPKIYELGSKSSDSDEINRQILSKTDPRHPVIVLDERGQNISSEDFANLIEQFAITRSQPFQFIIGPSDGVNDQIRGRADKVISFGKMTWPHLLSRILLLEQIYRAQTILSGHPYHK